MKKIIVTMLILALVCFTVACGPQSGSTTGRSTDSSGETDAQESADSETYTDPNESMDINLSMNEEREKTLEEKMENTIQATITMEDGGIIVVELYPEIAPQSVYNFAYLVREGFYDGLKFHRIISGFMIQGGCPEGTGYGNPGYSIKGEFSANGFENNLIHSRGVLSMARSGAPNSAGSQFFIMHADSPHLDGAYAAFGKVTDGMDVVDQIAKTPVTDSNGTVAKDNMPVISSITIDDDIELPEPERLR